MKPFFIVGAPRSGTTMLRDIFKQVEGLYSPEETHFFRWGEPFRGNEYAQAYKKNKILKKHREIDGINDADFQHILNNSLTKAELTEKYCEMAARKHECESWFEKTPQNVYGLPLIADQFPDTKVIHIVRHPFSVVKSLLVGKVIKVNDFIGAVNYWAESLAIVNILKPALSDRLIEVKYEDLQSNSEEVMKNLSLELFGEDRVEFNLSHIGGESSIPFNYFSEEEKCIINKICEKYANIYGYNI